jgi:tripartite-type tricarboxylate transporter receptor subunit TctC
MAEAGVSNYEVTTWYAIWAPAGTPADIVNKLQQEVAKAMQAPMMKEVWSQQGATAGGNTPAEFAQFVKQEIVKWGEVAKAAGARID